MKWDFISKEQLDDLFIQKNMSKPEISKILCIPTTSLDRLLNKYGIIKPEKLLKEMQSRISKETHDRGGEEAKKNLSIKSKAMWNSLSDEEKEKRMNVLKNVNTNRTKEHRNKLAHALKEYYKNETEEDRAIRIKRTSECTKIGMRNMSKEKVEQMYRKRAETVKNQTPEQKRQKVERYKKTISLRSVEENNRIYEKIMTSKIKNGTCYISSKEAELKEFIESLGFKVNRLAKGYKETRFELDIFIEDLNIAIEYNGAYYHSTNGCNKRSKSYHYNKSLTAESMGISLIHVWEDQWLNKKDLIKTILKSRLNVLNENRIYARKCKIKEVNVSEYKQFCEENHIQGYRPASVRLGLFYNDELVQIASFNKIRNIGKQNRTEEWEWVRGCPASLNSVVGGTSKLFSYFVKTYYPNSVLCYADWNLFDGSGYDKCGFVFDGYTGPDKFYIKNRGDRSRVSRNPYKFREYNELVKSCVLFECYGAGSKRFIWNKK